MDLKELLLRPDEHGAAIGMTGTGKSTLCKYLLPHTGNLAIMDPKRTFQYPLEVFDSAKKIWRAKPKRFIFRPHPDLLGDQEEMNSFYKYCFLFPPARGDKKKITVYTDDAVGVVDIHKPPHYLKVVYQMGREFEVSCISAFQRPVSLPGCMMTDVHKIFAFMLTKSEDIKRVQSLCPGYNPKKLPSEHHFFAYDVRSREPAKILHLDIPGK